MGSTRSWRSSQAGSSPTRTPPSTRTELGLGLALVAAVAVLAGLAYGVRGDRTYRWDRGPVSFFDEHYYDYSTFREAVEAGVWATLVLGGIAALLLFVGLLAERAYRRAAFWGLTVVSVLVVTGALKALIQRPEIGQFDEEFSFPSGNSTAATAAALAFVLLTRSPVRRLAAWTAVVVLPVYGVALVLLLWHYPSDVVAGCALGVALVSALRLALGEVSGPVPGQRLVPHSFRRSSSEVS